MNYYFTNLTLISFSLIAYVILGTNPMIAQNLEVEHNQIDVATFQSSTGTTRINFDGSYLIGGSLKRGFLESNNTIMRLSTSNNNSGGELRFATSDGGVATDRYIIDDEGYMGMNRMPSPDAGLTIAQPIPQSGQNQSALYAYRAGSFLGPGSGGTGWGLTQVDSAIKGHSDFGDTYSCGVYGFSFLDHQNSAGIMGYGTTFSGVGPYWGALAYQDNLSNYWSGYFNSDVAIDGQLRLGGDTGGYTLPSSDGAAGEVLTTDGAGNVSWQGGGGSASTGPGFSAWLTVDEVIFSSTSNILDALSEEYDATNDFNPMTGVFTVPSTGMYSFDIELAWGPNSPVSDRTLLFLLERNGSTMRAKAEDIIIDNLSGRNNYVNFTVPLVAGDTVHFEFSQQSGTQQTLKGSFISSASRITGYKVN